jgi:hypothetical protein
VLRFQTHLGVYACKCVNRLLRPTRLPFRHEAATERTPLYSKRAVSTLSSMIQNYRL